MVGSISDQYQGPDGGRDPYYEGGQAFRDDVRRDANPETDEECRDLWWNGWDDEAAEASLMGWGVGNDYSH